MKDKSKEHKEAGQGRLEFPEIQLFEERPKARRKDMVEHREQILEAARHLFDAQGIEQVNMHQIAIAANVGQGTLYRHFLNKGELCMKLLEDSAMSFQAELLDYLRKARGEESTLEQLYGTLIRIMNFTEKNAPLLGASQKELGGQAYQNPFYQWLRKVVMVLLREGIEEQEIQGQDSDYMVDIILAPLTIELYNYQRQQLGFSQQRIAEGLHSFIFNNIGK